MSMAQFGSDIATDRVARLIEVREASAAASSTRGNSPRIASALRRVADRLDPPPERTAELAKP